MIEAPEDVASDLMLALDLRADDGSRAMLAFTLRAQLIGGLEAAIAECLLEAAGGDERGAIRIANCVKRIRELVNKEQAKGCGNERRA